MEAAEQTQDVGGLEGGVGERHQDAGDGAVLLDIDEELIGQPRIERAAERLEAGPLESDCLGEDAQEPVQFGGRFSKKAAMPSCASAAVALRDITVLVRS